MSNLSNDRAVGVGGRGERLPYSRPRLGKVRLEADQVLTAGCKTGVDGPNSGQPSPCLVGPCNQTIGS